MKGDALILDHSPQKPACEWALEGKRGFYGAVCQGVGLGSIFRESRREAPIRRITNTRVSGTLQVGQVPSLLAYLLSPPDPPSIL